MFELDTKGQAGMQSSVAAIFRCESWNYARYKYITQKVYQGALPDIMHHLGIKINI